MPAKSFELLDGVALNAANPDRCEIPTDSEKAGIVVGDFVLLGFAHPDGGGEKMHVRVTGDGVGVLDNQPILISLQLGDEVRFQPENILDITKIH